MAASKLVVKEFKGTWAVIDPDGDQPAEGAGGEVLTRVPTKEQADDYVKRLRGTSKED